MVIPMRRTVEDRKDRKVIHRRGFGGWAGMRNLLIARDRETAQRRRPQEWFSTVRDAFASANRRRLAP